MAKLAFLGLGVMGYPMAGHLQNAGHAVTVYNRTTAKAEKWAAEYGGSCAVTPRAAAEGADVVLSCVGNDDDLRAVVLGADGALAGMAEGALYVDHTTVSAIVTRASWAQPLRRWVWGGWMPCLVVRPVQKRTACHHVRRGRCGFRSGGGGCGPPVFGATVHFGELGNGQITQDDQSGLHRGCNSSCL